MSGAVVATAPAAGHEQEARVRDWTHASVGAPGGGPTRRMPPLPTWFVYAPALRLLMGPFSELGTASGCAAALLLRADPLRTVETVFLVTFPHGGRLSVRDNGQLDASTTCTIRVLTRGDVSLLDEAVAAEGENGESERKEVERGKAETKEDEKEAG